MTKNLMIGYARVSREDQNLSLQTQAILARGVDEKQLFTEKVSGVSKKRPQFDLCKKRLRRGDTLVVWKLDRLGRNLKDLCELSDMFKSRGIELVSLTEGVDTSTALGKFFYHIMAALAQFERDLISERTTAGIAASKADGNWKSKPVSFSEDMWKLALVWVAAVKKKNEKLPEEMQIPITAKGISEASGLKISIVHKHLDKLKNEIEWLWGENTIANQKKGKKK